MALLVAEGFEHIRGTLDYERRFVESSPSGVPSSLTQIDGRFPGSKCIRAVNGQVYTLRTHDLTPGSVTAILSFHLRSKGSALEPSSLIIGMMSAANVQQIVVDCSNIGGAQSIVLRRGSTHLYDSPELPLEEFYHVELRVLISPTIGEWDLRINDMTVSSGEGNTANGGTSGFARLFAGFSSDTSVDSYIDLDDLILMDDSGEGSFNKMLGPVGIECLVPVRLVSGSHSNWTPNTGTNRAAVDDASSGVADDDTTYIDNSAAGVSVDYYGMAPVTSLHSSTLNIRPSIDARETSADNDLTFTMFGPDASIDDLDAVLVESGASYDRYSTDSEGRTPEDIFDSLFGIQEDSVVLWHPVPV